MLLNPSGAVGEHLVFHGDVYRSNRAKLLQNTLEERFFVVASNPVEALSQTSFRVELLADQESETHGASEVEASHQVLL